MILSLPLVLLFVLFAGTYLVRPIIDPDVFWHIKSGEWLWLKHHWPIPDPFAFTSPEEFNLRQLFIIKGYWLAQLIYFSLHSLFGWAGLVVLRFVLFTVLFLALWTRRSGDRLIWAGLVFIYLISVLSFFPVERPQFFTFIFFAWLYLLLDQHFSGVQIIQRSHVVITCALMLLWGNLHGGVIIGQLLLVLGAVCVGIRGLFYRTQSNFSENRKLLLFLGASLAFSFCNPNALKLPVILYQTASATDIMFATNDEFDSLMQLLQGNKIPQLIPYVTFLAFGLWGLIVARKAQPLFSALLMVGTAIYAGMDVRYHPLFMVTVLPIAARSFGAPSVRRIAAALVVFTSIFFGLFFTRAETNNLARVREMGWVSDNDFPVAVAERFLQRPGDSHLFNLYRWGGYLLWRIGPEHKVFVDGRAFDAGVIRDALAAELVSFKKSGVPLWKQIFEKHQIDSAILPRIEGGAPYGLSVALYRDPDWILDYQSGNAALFLKRR
jgi:hypothetical protein